MAAVDRAKARFENGNPRTGFGSPTRPPTYSIVVPIWNEEECLLELGRRLARAADELDGPAEIILVDDGSTDASSALVDELTSRDPRFRSIRLSRNFGHQIALTAGLDAARATGAVVTMDADLQHPPEHIHRLVKLWREGYEVVFAVMQEREQVTWLKRRSAEAFYWTLQRMAPIEVPAGAGDFRLIDRRALDVFLGMPERHRYLRGMFSWIGFRQIGCPYTSPGRFGGSSKYTLSSMVRLAGDALFSFADRPLLFVLKLGLLVSVLSFLFGAGTVVSKLVGIHNVPGYVSIVALVSFLGGIQLLVLGAIGEYVARIFEEVKGRPLYVLDTSAHDEGEVRALAEHRSLPVESVRQ